MRKSAFSNTTRIQAKEVLHLELEGTNYRFSSTPLVATRTNLRFEGFNSELREKTKAGIFPIILPLAPI